MSKALSHEKLLVKRFTQCDSRLLGANAINSGLLGMRLPVVSSLSSVTEITAKPEKECQSLDKGASDEYSDDKSANCI